MGRVRITRPFVLLALAVLLAPRAEASRTSVWESNPPAAAVLTTTNAAGLLAPLAPAVPHTLPNLTDAEAIEPRHFDLGDVVLVESPREKRFRIGLADVVEPPALRGPPALDEDPHRPFELCDPENRVRGFELLPPFRVGASPALSLWSRQACGFSCREVVSDSPEDPWGLEQTSEMKDQSCAVTGIGCASTHDANAIWNSQVVQGSLESVGGAVQTGIGIGAMTVPDPTLVSKVAGGIAILRGLDHMVAGWRSIWARKPVRAVSDAALERSFGGYGVLAGAGLDFWSVANSVGASRPTTPEKAPFPAPEAAERYRWSGHRNAAETEEALARTVHDLPGEVVIRWGDPIGTHGADVISVNIDRYSGRVTLWDAKYRGNPVAVQPSKTFALEPRIQNAVDEAIVTLERNASLSLETRRKALENLRRGIFETRTVGAGNAKNSVLR